MPAHQKITCQSPFASGQETKKENDNDEQHETSFEFKDLQFTTLKRPPRSNMSFQLKSNPRSTGFVTPKRNTRLKKDSGSFSF